MRYRLRPLSLGIIAGLLVLLPLVAGKLWVWQGLWVALVAGLAAVLWLLSREPVAESKPVVKPAKRQRSPQPATPKATVISEPSPPWRPDVVDIALAVFLLTQAVSWLGSVYPFATALYVAKVMSYALLFWLLRYGPRGRWQRVMLWGLCLGGALAGVWALREYVRTVWFLEQDQWRVFGPMYNPNALAAYLLLSLPPAAALLLGSQTRADRSPEVTTPRYAEIAAGFGLLVMLPALLLTGSKGGLAALLVGLMVTAVVAPGSGVRGRRARLAAGGLIVVVIGLVLALPPIRSRIVSAFGSQSHSAVFRAYTWQTTLNMIKAAPLIGFGGGTFEQTMPAYAIAGYTRAAHQSYLQIAAETGLWGLLAGLGWGVVVLWRLGVGSRRHPQRLGRLVCAAALGGLVASGAQELVDYAWYCPAVGAAFFALAGLGLAYADELGQTRRYGWSPGKGWRIAAVMVLAGLVVWSGKNLYAEAVAGRAEGLAAQRAYAAASMAYERALRLNPGQARFWAQRSRIEEALALSGDRAALARAAEARLAASRLQPTEPQHYVALSRLYEMADRLPEALAAAREAIARYPTYPRGLAQLAQVQARSGDRAGALATYRRLNEVYESPVGRYPAVPEIVETAFAYAWLGLGEEALRQGDWVSAGGYYGQAVAAVANELARNRFLMTQLGEGGKEAWEENLLAGLVREHLGQLGGPLADWWQARLWQAQGKPADEQVYLQAALAAPAQRPEEWQAQAAAALSLARQLPAEATQEKARLVAKGLSLLQSGSAAEKLDDRLWRPEDQARLQELKTWAESQRP
jgi:O-antigen ligase